MVPGLALREGRELPSADSLLSRLAAAAPYDADVFRALLETVLCLALPQDVIARPGMKERLTSQPSTHRRSSPDQTGSSSSSYWQRDPRIGWRGSGPGFVSGRAGPALHR